MARTPGLPARPAMAAFSFAPGRGRTAYGPSWPHGAVLRDPLFWLFAALGLIGLALPAPGYDLIWYLLLAKAFAEEFLLRYLLQDTLLKFAPFKDRLWFISTANLTASLVFVALHLFGHSLFQALLVFFPSLIFGYVWERYGRLWAPVALHFFYNVCLFYHDTLFQ